MRKLNLGTPRRLLLLGAIGSLLIGLNLHPGATKAKGAKGAAPGWPAAPATISLTPVLSGLTRPVFVTNAHDGSNRLFIVEQPGRIKVLQPGATSATTFLDITAKVLSTGNEQGLLGLTFHPQFKTNGSFFVNYTQQTDGATVIAEYHASPTDPNVADTNERKLLTIPQPYANHNGGMTEFGPDKFLYIGMGDGGSANDPQNRAQNVDELLGKLLRLDVDHLDIDNPGGLVPYTSPPDNPFFGATPGRDEIYALGLRNPWRWSFDRATGQLYAGDVGQDTWEEVDIITRGGNYGWRVMEGLHCNTFYSSTCDTTGFILPITEYHHDSGRCSITGGYVYRGPKATFAAGTYLFADYCTGEIFTFSGGTMSLLMDTTANISSFGEDEAGELYVVNLNGSVSKLTSDATPPCSFTIDASSQDFPAGGGSGNVNVSAPAGCSWNTTNNNPEFINLSSGSGSGDGTVRFTVAGNGAASSRSGTLTIAGQTFTVKQGASFADVSGNPFITEIGKISAAGITGGCGGPNYCPSSPVTREQAAIFIVRALGLLDPPAPARQRFDDVPSTRPGYRFIEELARRGITGGCDSRNFCPDNYVTREQAAIFIERALREYTPPTPSGQTFADVSATRFSYPFIEDFVRRGITSGCAAGSYCPDNPVVRDQMATFLVRAFKL